MLEVSLQNTNKGILYKMYKDGRGQNIKRGDMSSKTKMVTLCPEDIEKSMNFISQTECECPD